MKKKYYTRPSKIIFLDIIQIINKYQDIKQASIILKKKIGLNDKQLDYVLYRYNSGNIDDSDILHKTLIAMEPYGYKSKRLRNDLRFIFLSVISYFGIMIIFVALSLACLLVAIYDVKESTQWRNGMFYFVVPIIILVGIYASSFEFKYITMYFNLKKDIEENNISNRTFSEGIKINTLKEYKYRKRQIIGYIIYNKENGKTVKYYLFARDRNLSGLDDLKKIINLNRNIKYYIKSKYIIYSQQ